MNRLYLDSFCDAFSGLSQRVQVASTQAKGSPNSAIPPIWLNDTILMLLTPLSISVAPLGLHESNAMILRLINDWDKPKVTCEEYFYGLLHLSELMQNEMKKHWYFSIPDNLVHYCEAEKPFGGEVFEAFPSARFDIRQAGNCLAYSCHTGAGFHLMRAAEIGLRELARDRQVKSVGTVEFEEWGILIKELEEATKSIQQWPKSALKEEAHRFYNHSLVEIRAFNDGWRRHIAHVRTTQKPLEPDEALSLWGHVSRFLGTLATKISEGSYTLLVWSESEKS
jgi:hypothetical protein